ncbi:MAG: SET domain-containing protein-lysine N-methyltransferase [Minisyncoccia bacterium]
MKIQEVLDKFPKTYVANSPGKGRGLFAGESISAGTIIALDPIVFIDDRDWDLIKNTRLVKMYGLQWHDDKHAIPTGDIKYNATPEEQRIFEQTKIFRKGVYVSPFLLVNHSDNPNCEEIIDKENQHVGIRAIKFIEAGQEILKRYNYVTRKPKQELEFD